MFKALEEATNDFKLPNGDSLPEEKDDLNKTAGSIFANGKFAIEDMQKQFTD